MQFHFSMNDNNAWHDMICTAPPEEGADLQPSFYLYSDYTVAFQYSHYNHETLTDMVLRGKKHVLFQPLL